MKKISLFTPLPLLVPQRENHVSQGLLSFIHSPYSFIHSFTHSFIHSFNKYVLSIYLLPATVFGAGGTVVKKMNKAHILSELIFCGGRHTISTINK